MISAIIWFKLSLWTHKMQIWHRLLKFHLQKTWKFLLKVRKLLRTIFFQNWFSAYFFFSGHVECSCISSAEKFSSKNWKVLTQCPKKKQKKANIIFQKKIPQNDRLAKLSMVLRSLPTVFCSNLNNFFWNIKFLQKTSPEWSCRHVENQCQQDKRVKHFLSTSMK